MISGLGQRVDRALLIGVDRYQYIWPPLGGCVNDIEAVASLLMQRMHLPPGQLIKLTAGHACSENSEELATRANIVRAFQGLAAVATTGEQIYIHYSGHGMRNDGTVLPGYEADGRDEAIAPTDSGYQDQAAYYILDKELGWLIRQITRKGAFATVILDCCHSASGTRNLEDTIKLRCGRRRPEDAAPGRSWEGGDSRPRPDGTLVAPLAELRQVIESAPCSSGALVVAPMNYVLLTACLERETAKEYNNNGLFTHHLLELFNKGFANLTYRSVRDQVAGAILQLASSDSRYADQTPQLEGDGNFLVFGGGSLAQPPSIVASPQADDTILLSGGGAAVGVVPGTTVALYPPGTVDWSGASEQIGLATVTEVQAHASVARASEDVPRDRLIPGMQARIIRPGVVKLKRRVGIGQDPDLDELKCAIKAGNDGKGSPYLDVVGLNDYPEFSVIIDAGHYLVRDARDQVLPRISPSVTVGGQAAARQVLRRLEHIVQYRNAWELKNGDGASRLRKQLAISVEREGAGEQIAGRVKLHPGDIVRFRLHNRAGRNLSAAMLYFSPNWSIRRIWPTGVAYTELKPTDVKGLEVLRQRVQLPPGIRSGVERLKLFATDRPTSFEALELGSLDTHGTASGRGLPQNALEQLLANIGRARTTRQLVAISSTGDWGTAELELKTEVCSLPCREPWPADGGDESGE